MIIEIIIAIFLGIIAGTITGLAPGIHINLVALGLFMLSASLLNYTTAFVLCIFIISMTIVHTFLDFIPSIFLGAPDEETALSVLPGHELLMKGKGFAAAKLSIDGCFYALIFVILCIPVFILIMPVIYPILKQYMGLVLIVASLFLILNERKNKFWAFALFMLSGFLGIGTLNLEIIKHPLFPLLTGLFGTSMLFISIFTKVKIPKQNTDILRIEKKEKAKTLAAGILSGSLCSFLPGLGASQAAVIGSDISGKIGRYSFLFLIGAISMIVTVLNFVAIYTIGKPRSGTAVIVDKLLQKLSLTNLVYFLAVMFAVGCISYILAIKFSKIFALNIEKVDYSRLCAVILIFLVVLTVIFSGWIGLLVLITATSIGIVSSLLGVKKMHLMGCLMVPVIMYFI